MRQPAEDGRRDIPDAQVKDFSHKRSCGVCAHVCQGSFSAFWRKVPRLMLARARNEAKIVWMQESYLSLPVFSSDRRQVTRKPVGGFVLSVRCEGSSVDSRFSFDCTFCFLFSSIFCIHVNIDVYILYFYVIILLLFFTLLYRNR